jgi:hypothetical protein
MVEDLLLVRFSGRGLLEKLESVGQIAEAKLYPAQRIQQERVVAVAKRLSDRSFGS